MLCKHCEKKKETKKERKKNSLWALGNQSGIQYLTHIIRMGLRRNHIISPTYTESVLQLTNQARLGPARSL